MTTCFREPTLAELINDPLTHAVMQADHVNPQALENLLRDLVRRRADSLANVSSGPAVLRILIISLSRAYLSPQSVEERKSREQPIAWVAFNIIRRSSRLKPHPIKTDLRLYKTLHAREAPETAVSQIGGG
jgi:hypothetical protein